MSLEAQMRKEKIVSEITKEIRDHRKNLRFFQKDLAEYLHEHWGVSKGTASVWVHNFESHLLGRLENESSRLLRMRRTVIELNQQRIVDYLNALGMTAEHKQTIYEKIKQAVSKL